MIDGCYNLNERKLKVVKTEKDLGVYFDNKLLFEEHISIIIKKASSLLGMIRRSFVYLDKVIFKLLFVTIVRPHLEYAAPVWNPHLKKLITQIENVQRRGTKLLPGMKDLTYKQRLKAIGLPTLEYRRYRGDMIELFKLTHNLYDVPDLLNLRADNCTERASTAHQYTIMKGKYTKDVRKYFFINRVADQWNNLPNKVVSSTNLNMFKNRLDKIWKINDVMYDAEVDLYQITSLRPDI